MRRRPEPEPRSQRPAPPPSPPSSPSPPSRRSAASWAPRFVRNVALWLVPAWALWALLTPAYNRFLLVGAENLVHLVESPDVTDLHAHPDNRHDAYIARRDFPPSRTLVRPLRVTDLHFHLVLLGALFLAVPGRPWRQRLGNLGIALLVAVFFHLALLVLYVKFAYATQLGDWSLANYGPFARNAWGLAKHLLDLPLKLALPFALWAAFYLSLFRDEREYDAGESS